MSPPENDGGRPGEERPRNVVSTDSHSLDDGTPCERCGRPLHAARSVERGLGPVCCRHEAAA